MGDQIHRFDTVITQEEHERGSVADAVRRAADDVVARLLAVASTDPKIAERAKQGPLRLSLRLETDERRGPGGVEEPPSPPASPGSAACGAATPAGE